MVEPQNLLLKSLPRIELKRLLPLITPVELGFKDLLVEFEQPIQHVYFLETVVTSTIVQTRDGETIEVGLMGAEGFVGLSLLFGVTRSNGTVIVQVPGKAWRMDGTVFQRQILQRDGPCREVLLRYANFFGMMVQQHAACNATHTIRERMSRWILLTHDRVGTDQFPLTQEYLALMLGVRRPTLSQIAQDFRKEGGIDYKRGKVTVLNRRRLEQLTCECYEVVSSQFNRIFSEDPASKKKR